MSSNGSKGFKRPNHPDFMDSSELKKIEFSGVRINKLAQQIECWILGEVQFSSPLSEYEKNPGKFYAKYADRFCIDEIAVEEPAKQTDYSTLLNKRRSH